MANQSQKEDVGRRPLTGMPDRQATERAKLLPLALLPVVGGPRADQGSEEVLPGEFRHVLVWHQSAEEVVRKLPQGAGIDLSCWHGEPFAATRHGLIFLSARSRRAC